MSTVVQRRLAAIVAADVVGYSRLMGADEAGTLAALRAHRAELIDGLIDTHGGRIVKTMGDGLLLEFPSAVNATLCAIAVQEGMAARNAEIADDQRIILRIGINQGDIIIDGDDIHGDGVNVAARLEAMAAPGGICISARVHDDVRDKLDARFDDRGEANLKNIARPVGLWMWRAGHAAPAAPDQPPPPTDQPSVVVLPFDNMSDDREQEYFSDGITEDIITDLSKVPGLLVIARNSTFVYKGKTFNVPDVCRELGVGFALEGSVRKAANRVRVTAQLIDGSTGGHLWAERYDRDLTDIFAVQDEVTQEIVGALKIKLGHDYTRPIAVGGTRDMEAHDNFLRGRALLFKVDRDREMFTEASAYFQRAIDLDPNYAAAYAGLGFAYVLDFQNH